LDERVADMWEAPAASGLASRPQALAGSRWDWAAELALLGMFYGLAAPAAMGGPVAFGLCASFGGAAAGAFLGWHVPRALERIRRWPGSLLVVGAGGIGLGAVWGGIAGLAGGIGVGWPTVAIPDGATVGALLGLVGSYPLVAFHVLGIPRTSLLAVLCALAPLLGVVAA
jgi:hypothetical protein